jgi:hypothetical protein
VRETVAISPPKARKVAGASVTHGMHAIVGATECFAAQYALHAWSQAVDHGPAVIPTGHARFRGSYSARRARARVFTLNRTSMSPLTLVARQ